jgi:hypothetical protein
MREEDTAPGAAKSAKGASWRSLDTGHGGWFGDSEGRSEAARRGWENR